MVQSVCMQVTGMHHATVFHLLCIIIQSALLCLSVYVPPAGVAVGFQYHTLLILFFSLTLRMLEALPHA
jgi:hypothetical protein